MFIQLYYILHVYNKNVKILFYINIFGIEVESINIK